MDGTLVDDDKNIDPEIFGLLPKLKAAGIRFVEIGRASCRERVSASV